MLVRLMGVQPQGDRRAERQAAAGPQPVVPRRRRCRPTVGQVLRGQGRLRQLLLQQAGARPAAERRSRQPRRLRRPDRHLDASRATATVKGKRPSTVEFTIAEEKEQGRQDRNDGPLQQGRRQRPVRPGAAEAAASRTRTCENPPGSGGLLMALYPVSPDAGPRREGLRGELRPRRREPFYPPADGQARLRQAARRLRGAAHQARRGSRPSGTSRRRTARCWAARSIGWTTREGPVRGVLLGLQEGGRPDAAAARSRSRYGKDDVRRRST